MLADCRHRSRRSPRAGSTTGAAPSCSTRSPGCPSYYPTRTETALLTADHARDRGAHSQRNRGRRIRRRIGDQDAAPARGDRACGLCPGRHFGRLPAAKRGRSRSSASRRSTVIPVVADFARPFSSPAGDRRLAQARLLSGLDHRQFRAPHRDRPAAPFPRPARRRRAAADRDGPGEAGRAADRRL